MPKILLTLFILFLPLKVYAYTDTQICNAIFKAEGELKAKYYYGIRSVKYKDIEEAKQICLNTIRNQHLRHAKHKCNKDFLTCLWYRYCPPQAHKLNKNWLKNVKYFLERSKK